MLTKIKSLPLIQGKVFENEDWLVHGFGLKDIPIEKYLGAFDIPRTSIPKTKQVHGNKVYCWQSALPDPGMVFEGDAFLTDQSGLVCFVKTADCLPVLIADPKKGVVGAIHAGWRGMVNAVIAATLEQLKKKWGSDFKDLKVALGPAIGGHCYRVGGDVISAMEKAGLYPGPWVEERDRNHWYLDIAFANLHQLEKAGVQRGNIYLSLACTACDLSKFHSFRKEEGKLGEQVSFIVKR